MAIQVQIGEELTHVDDIEVSNLPIESIHILLSGPPDSKVRLHLISLGGVGRDVFPKQDSLGQAVDKLVKGGIPAQNEKAGVGEIYTPSRRAGRPGTVRSREAGTPPTLRRRHSLPECL